MSPFGTSIAWQERLQQLQLQHSEETARLEAVQNRCKALRSQVPCSSCITTIVVCIAVAPTHHTCKRSKEESRAPDFVLLNRSRPV